MKEASYLYPESDGSQKLLSMKLFILLQIYMFKLFGNVSGQNLVVNTWSGDFSRGTMAAYNALKEKGNAIDAVEIGCSICEFYQCDHSVGYGSNSDTSGYTTLDAMIMDGKNMEVGSVAYLRRYRNAISVARHIMEYSDHTLLVGDGAESFEDMLGILSPMATTTNSTVDDYNSWKHNRCQPNFYRNLNGAKEQCPPYTLSTGPRLNFASRRHSATWASPDNHDTIGMIVHSVSNEMACGTSTNGANHKIAGRVGDSPVVGSGCYVDNSVGGATATGDGDIMMRFLPAFSAVMFMRMGLTPTAACQEALKPIIYHYPKFSGALVCLNNVGQYGAAAYNIEFTFSVMKDGFDDIDVIKVDDMNH